jgi:beta-phosphoglucomutase-like phosphatase (HAD superfamily)
MPGWQPSGSHKAVPHFNFDCDGVLIEPEPLSMQVDVEILAENGIHMSEAAAQAPP